MTTQPGPTIERSRGLPITINDRPTGYLAGGGYAGLTEELDAIVARAAEALGAAYGMNVVIRFNSDRRSGGAWLRTDAVDSFTANTQIGINAGLRHTHQQARAEFSDIPELMEELLAEPDGGIYVSVYIASDRLRDPAEANSGSTRPYLSLHQPDVAAAVAFCLEHATPPEQAR